MLATARESAILIVYEHPFNEGIRTMLRLEHLFDRLDELVKGDSATDHHFALATMFEIMDVAARADLKSDLLLELERHKTQFTAYRGHPGIAEGMLDAVIARLDGSHAGLNQLSGKAGHQLTSNDWLMSVRSRISIPGGTCEFDLPAYFAWQHLDAVRRRADLTRWITQLAPLGDAIRVLIGLLRESGTPQRMLAVAGQYQQSLPPGRSYHLMRVRVDGSDGLVPEISGHRLIVSVRMMRPDAEGRLRATQADAPFELTLCN